MTIFKKKIHQRIFSLALFLAVLAGSCPTLPLQGSQAAAAGEPAGIVYDFHAPEDVSSPFALKIGGGSPWEIDEPNCATRIRSKGRGPIRFQPCGISAQVTVANDPPESDIALTIRVEEDGYYTPSFSGGGYNDGCIASLYLDGALIGEYSFYDLAGTAAKPAQAFEPIRLAAGNHALVIRASREEAAGQFWMYPGALTLTPTPQPPADIVYDFHAPSDDISPFALKISGGSLWEIDEPNCAPRIQSTGRSPIRFQPCGFYSSLSAVNSPPDSDVALNLQVAAAGYYTPKFTGGGYNDGCIAALYLDGVYLGEYSFFDSAGTSAKEAASLRTLYLDAGRHSLLIRGMREVAANQFWMYPGGLTLQGVHAPPALTQIIATAAESTLQIGETLDVSCQLAFAGGAVIPAAPNLASAASAGIALH